MLTVASPLMAAPTVNSVNYDVAGGQVTIKGAGFGNKAKVELYDTFEDPNAKVGADVSMSATLGEWTTANKYYVADYTSVARSGRFGFRAYSHESGKAQTLTKDFSPSQEVFLSYWVKLDGSYFPGDLVSAPNTFSSDSSWKLSWIMDSDWGEVNPNICLPTHVGGGRFTLAGNSHSIKSAITNSWWSWNDWMRISIWMKANEKDPRLPGTVVFQALSKEKGLFQMEASEPVFNQNDVLPKQYRRLNIPGWIKTIKDPGTTIVYDDVYLAVGASAVARVEIGNAPIYKDVTALEIQTAASWKADEIRFSLNRGNFKDAEKLYVFITDKDGKVSKGMPLSDAVAPPLAPVLKVANK